MSSTPTAWFRQHFNDDYRTLYSGRTQEQAEAEIAFVVQQLEITPKDRVLDLCCGHGRHLRSLAAHGISVVGVDLSEPLLRQVPRGEGIEIVCADMRHLPFAGGTEGFTVLVNFFTSFGYFDSDEENRAAAREMARVLRPGGRFLIDLMNLRTTVDSLVPRTERRAGPFEVVEERSFDEERRRLEKHIRLVDTRNGERKEYVESVRVYEEDEIRELLASEGLDVERVFGDFKGNPPGGPATRMLVIGKRRAESESESQSESESESESEPDLIPGPPSVSSVVNSESESKAASDPDRTRPRFTNTRLPETWRHHPRLASDTPVTSLPSLDDIDQATKQVDRLSMRLAFDATYTRDSLPLADTARRNLDALTSDDAVCVVTGQQPGFLGGPLFTLYKALTAIATAERVEATLGRRCVPVFWVASEDHDIDEVRTARFADGSGGETELTLPHASERAPLSTLAIDDRSNEVLEQAARFFDSRQYGDIARTLIDLYRGRSVAGGFAAIVASIFGEHGLLVITPESLRPLARPLFRKIIENAHGALDAIREGAREIENRGLKPVVRPRLPLFIVRDGKRHHLSPATGGLAIDGGGPTLATEDLLRLVDEDPSSFSAGALLRPLVERHTLPSVLTIGGAAEVDYFAQLGPFARWLGVDAPKIGLRFHATLLDGRAARAWDKLGVNVDRFASAISPEALAAANSANPTDDALSKLRDDAQAIGEALLGELPGDRKGIERGNKTIAHAIDRLIERVATARSRGDQERFTAATTIWNALLPVGSLQERRHGLLDLIAGHGTVGIDALLDVVRRTESTSPHQLLRLDGRDA
jgi:bacillithiol biosynthesis cysteine-adding enzyme BshC